MKSVSKLTIKSLVERSFVFASFVVLVIITISALYFNQKSIQERRDSNLRKIHQILTNLISPELSISNTSEIRRLLQLASSPDEMFVVVDGNGMALMSDYSKTAIADMLRYEETTDCQAMKTLYRKIGKQGYWITCSPLLQENVLSGSQKSAVLLTFSRFKWLFFSTSMLYFIALAAIVLLLIIYWFRLTLYRRLLEPTIVLCSRIVQMSESPLTTETSIGDIGNAPVEITSIKYAFEAVLTNLQREYAHRTESDKKAILLDLAAQVAHDIRSPLAVMEMTLATAAKYLPVNDANIQREAIQSVRDIANNLLTRYRGSIKSHDLVVQDDNDSLCRHVFIFTLVEQMISLKRHEWQKPSCEISFIYKDDIKFEFIIASSSEIKRLFSNLLNNAYEALAENKYIQVILETTNSNVNLRIIDSGVGIPSGKIEKVLGGMSLKHNGRGLGLSNAKATMESIGGGLSIKSIQGHGTEVLLSFKRASQPLWFPKAIILPNRAQVVILDDDPAIHNMWCQRFKLQSIQLMHFYNSNDFLSWYENNLETNAIYLVDYELRDDVSNGLDVLQRINVINRSYLVTSHFNDASIQNSIDKIGVWLIPKTLAGIFPITYLL